MNEEQFAQALDLWISYADLNHDGIVDGTEGTADPVSEKDLGIVWFDPSDSTWKDIDTWNAWKENKERAEIQNQIDVMLDEPTEYEIFGNL